METMFPRAIRWLDHILFALISIMVVLVFANVIGRLVFSSGITWADEAARFAFVWMTYVGATVATARGAHIGMDLVAQFVSPATQRIFDIIGCVLVLVFLAVWGIYGLQLIDQNMTYLAPATQVPMGFVYAIGPAAAAGMAVLFVARLFHLVRAAFRAEP